MRQTLCVAAVAGLWSLAGCAFGTAGSGGLADPAVEASMDAIGGAARWRELRSVEAKAVVSTHDASGAAMINLERQKIDVAGGSISAEADLPGGGWQASVRLTGSPSFSSRGAAVSATHQGLLVDGLRTALHRVRGPLNLLDGTERAGASEPVRVSGAQYVRVPVSGSPVDARAYYFDAETKLLRMVTAGGDAPGQKGTVTVYTYQMQPNGLAFPVRLDVRRIGRHVLVGEEKVLTVDYQQVGF